jgi:hypothetical protein
MRILLVEKEGRERGREGRKEIKKIKNWLINLTLPKPKTFIKTQAVLGTGGSCL